MMTTSAEARATLDAMLGPFYGRPSEAIEAIGCVEDRPRLVKRTHHPAYQRRALDGALMGWRLTWPPPSRQRERDQRVAGGTITLDSGDWGHSDAPTGYSRRSRS